MQTCKCIPNAVTLAMTIIMLWDNALSSSFSCKWDNGIKVSSQRYQASHCISSEAHWSLSVNPNLRQWASEDLPTRQGVHLRRLWGRKQSRHTATPRWWKISATVKIWQLVSQKSTYQDHNTGVTVCNTIACYRWWLWAIRVWRFSVNLVLVS